MSLAQAAGFAASAISWDAGEQVFYMGGGNGMLLRVPWDKVASRPLPGSGLKKCGKHLAGAVRTLQVLSVRCKLLAAM